VTAERTLKQFLVIYFCCVTLETLSRTTLWETLEYTIREIQEGFEMNGTHQLLVYVDDITLLGGNIYYKEKHRSSIR
jgi:hypothetical protein